VGSENEICGTLIGRVPENFQVKLVEDEISEIKWADEKELFPDIDKNPQIYCPWMLVALYFLYASDEVMIQKHKPVFDKWMKPEHKPILERSLKYHFLTNTWRLLS
jgi:isopentenyl-diphosphate delta-isomerase